VIAAVADTGPLLHLHEAGALHLLPCMAVVSIPMRVEQELRAETALSASMAFFPRLSVCAGCFGKNSAPSGLIGPLYSLPGSDLAAGSNPTLKDPIPHFQKKKLTR